MLKISKEEVLNYHLGGKIEVIPKKSFKHIKDLSIAYTPGVGFPCEEIKNDPLKSYKYTSKGNLVGIITNGTAVLGFGNIGAAASKPVMEGKAILFKKFAGIDAFDIEINQENLDKFCEIVKSISSTFGGINLEDIKAPECFEIEKRLKKELDIPVMHDDQHGTAIVSAAALLNALELVNKKIENVKIVINGAGAAAIACAKLYKKLGAKNIIMCDSKGVISIYRKDINQYKKEFATDIKEKTLKEVLYDADVFVGLSIGNLLNKEDIMHMNNKPIIFALANPIPEILPQKVYEVKKDAIVATGRSDFSNQINNVLAFPFIFRGALDTYSRDINDKMIIAAVKAIAQIAKKPVPEDIKKLYNDENLEFGKNYIIPKPFDKRLLYEVSSAVAETSIKTGSARIKEFDVNKYIDSLKELGEKL